MQVGIDDGLIRQPDGRIDLAVDIGLADILGGKAVVGTVEDDGAEEDFDLAGGNMGNERCELGVRGYRRL